MDPDAAERVSDNSRLQGVTYFEKGNFGRAFAHFLVSIKLNPANKTSLKSKFSKCLEKWGNVLEAKKRFDDLFNCYEQAIEVYPENEQIYKLLGHILLRCGSPKEAADYFRKHVASDASNLRAYRDLENACNLAVERWHFRMLNDQVRNLSFREAIVKKIKRGYRNVLDIGTGTGILSLFAVEGGAIEVFACDSSSAMTSIAAQVLEYHDITNVKLINKHSTDLNIPEDIEHRVSLVLCEIVDCGLLGEHVLQTLTNAWEHLLEPNGVVLPVGAALHLCGIQSEDLSITWTSNNFPPDLGLEKFTITVCCEDYDTEKLGKLPRGYSVVTNTVTPLTINFNDPLEMHGILEGKKDREVNLTFSETGAMNCVAGWFTLSIDEDIALETGPESPITCWEQAVFSCPQEIMGKIGDELKLQLSFKSGKLSVKIMNSVPKEAVFVSQNVLRVLNNDKYVSVLRAAAESLHDMWTRPVHILDGTVFPLLGLFYLKKGCPGDRLLCTTSSHNDEDFVRKVARNLGLENQVIFLPDGGIEDLLEKKRKFDVIVLPFVEDNGELNEHYLSRLSKARGCLNENGLLLPQLITVMGQLVHSDWLTGVSRVISTDVTCGYDIAPFINIYSVANHVDFRLASIDATPISDIFCLIDIKTFENCDEEFEKKNTLAIRTPAAANALTYWHDITILNDNKNTNFSTKDLNSHINQAAQLMDIKESEEIILITKYDKGLMYSKTETINI